MLRNKKKTRYVFFKCNRRNSREHKHEKKTTDKKPKLKLKPDGTQLVNGKFRSFLKMSIKSTRFKTCLRY